MYMDSMMAMLRSRITDKELLRRSCSETVFETEGRASIISSCFGSYCTLHTAHDIGGKIIHGAIKKGQQNSRYVLAPQKSRVNSEEYVCVG